MFVLIFVFKDGSLLVFTAQDLSFGNGFFFVVKCNCISITDSLDQRGTIQLLFELILVHFGNLGRSKISQQKLLHVVTHLLLFLIFWLLALLLRQKYFVKIDHFCSGNSLQVRLLIFSGNFFMFVTVFSIFTLLDSFSSHAIRDISHNNQRKEETQREICLPMGNFTIQEYNVQPNVGNY